MNDFATDSSHKLRAVVLADMDQPAGAKVTHNLLNQLGLDVADAFDAPAAVRDSTDTRTDLLLLDLPEPADQRKAVDDLLALPPGRRPRHVAIMSETINDDLIPLRRSMNQTKLHLFVKPLHLHGLLGVVKKLESDSAAATH